MKIHWTALKMFPPYILNMFFFFFLIKVSSLFIQGLINLMLALLADYVCIQFRNLQKKKKKCISGLHIWYRSTMSVKVLFGEHLAMVKYEIPDKSGHGWQAFRLWKMTRSEHVKIAYSIFFLYLVFKTLCW